MHINKGHVARVVRGPDLKRPIPLPNLSDTHKLIILQFSVEKAAADLSVTGLVADQGQLKAIEQLASQVSEKYSNEQLKHVKEWMTDRIPLKKIGSAGDEGKMVAYFCGPAADFITGAEIVMDGGMRL